MDLFELKNGRIIPSVHALMIEPFKTIWETDPDPKKSNAEKVFRYVELCLSPKKSNPYFNYEIDLRPSKVKKEVWGDEKKADTTFMIQACEKYRELLAVVPGYSMLEMAEESVVKVRDFFKTLDIAQRTSTGAYAFKPKDYYDAVNNLPSIIRNLNNVRSTVLTELTEVESRTRKEREVGMYED